MEKKHDIPELWTVPELAEYLKISKKGIYSLVETRRIPFIKVSNLLRFSRSDVIAWLQENRVLTSEER